MKKLHLHLLAGTALATVAMMGTAAQAPAQAQEMAKGFYLGAGVGLATHDGCEECDSTKITGTELGFKVLGGYQFHTNGAVEATWHYFGKAETTEDSTHESYGASLALLGILPLNPSTDVFFKAGAFFGRIEDESSSSIVDSSGFSPIVGLGVNFHFADSLIVRGEVEYVDNVGNGPRATSPGDVDVFAFTIDLIWQF